jgi:D-alanyl-D-alanine carboxypeptidase
MVEGSPINDHLGLSLQAQFEWHVDEQRIPGAAAAVTLPGRSTYWLSAGFEDLTAMRGMSSNGRFLIYSITKIYLAATVLRLAQQHKLALHDPLSSWCPEIDVPATITVRHLLNHTSGLPDYGSLASYQQAVEGEPKEPWSFDEFLRQTWKGDLAFEPGTGWLYSNIGYMLLGRIIERAACNSLAHALTTEILSPLRLDATLLVSEPAQLQSLVPGYGKTHGKNGMRDIREWYHPGWVSHGVLASTASDVNRFLNALFTGQLLDQRSLSEMLRTTPLSGLPPTLQAEYGLGIACETDTEFGRHYGHDGSGPGYRAVTSHTPQLHNTTITVLCNTDICNPRRISDSLMRIVLHSLKESQFPATG